MEYNQYWNEIKGVDDDVVKCEDSTKDEGVVSFSYSAVPEEPANNDEAVAGNIFDEEEMDSFDQNSEVDDSKMYSNSSLFDLIDEMEEKEEAEKEERCCDSRFISFDFKDDIEQDDKDVHIFADEFVDDDEDEEVVANNEEPAPEPEQEPVFEQKPEVVEPEVVELEPEVVEPEVVDQEPVVEEVPHFESPVFEDKKETDIDQLILEAKKKEEESNQRKLMDDAELLPMLKDIVSFMPANCRFVDYILSLGDNDRKDLARFIDQAKAAWIKDKTDKMFTIAEGCLSICILSDVTDPMREVQRLETIGAQMFSYDKESWDVVKLYFDQEGRLLRADTQLVNKDSFNSWQWRVVQQAGYNLWKSRQ